MAIITASIGANGRTYSTPQAWKDALPANIVASGNSYVGEMYNDGPFIGTLNMNGLVTDATHTVTLKAGAGQSFRDHANVRTNPLRANQAYGVLITSNGGYGSTITNDSEWVYFEGLQITQTNKGYASYGPANFKNCIVEGGTPGGSVIRLTAGSSNGSTENVLVVALQDCSGIQTANNNVHRNTTIVKVGAPTSVQHGAISNQYGSPILQNVVVANFGKSWRVSSNKNAASANNATTCADTEFTTNNNLVFADLFVDTTNDFRLKAGSPLINSGGAFGDATDITGTARTQNDIGAWEYSAADATPPAEQPPTGGQATAYRYIRLLITANNGDGYTSIQELQLRETVGGPTITTSATPATDNSHFPGEPANNMFDGDTTSPQRGWTGADGSTPPYTLTFDLGSARTLAEIALMRNPASYADNRAPKNFKLLGSNTGMDAQDFADITTYTNITGYVVGTYKTLAVTYPAPDTTAPTVTSIKTTEDGTKVIVTLGKTVVGDASSWPAAALSLPGYTFTLERNANSNEIVLGSLVPAVAANATLSLTYVKPASGGFGDTSGNKLASFGPSPVTNMVRNRPTLQGYTLKTYGDLTDHDFHTPAELATYIKSLSLTGTSLPVMIWTYKSPAMGNIWSIGPDQSTDANYVTMRPAPGLSYSELEADNAPSNYGTVGQVLDLSNATLRVGLVFEGYRAVIATGTSTWRRDGWGQGQNTQTMGLRKCRILASTTSRPFNFGEYGCTPFLEDCLLVIPAGAYAGSPIITSGGGRIIRSAMVRETAGNNTPLFDTSNGAGDSVVDSLFYNMGDNPSRSKGDHNYTNVPLAAGATGLTYVSGTFFNGANDYRPAAGSPMIGGATQSAISTNDNHDNNRGLNPDAGPTQLAPAMPLVVATVTSQVIDGTTLVMTFTTTNTPTSAKITLTPADPANGAVGAGPFDITLGNGTASVDLDVGFPGSYLAPTVSFTNAGGTTVARGAAAFEIAGFGNLVYDGGGVGSGTPDPVLTPPTLVITTADSAIMSGKRATISGSVNLQGDVAGHVDVFLEPRPSGASQSVGAANVTAGTWTKQVDIAPGLYQLRVVAVANDLTSSAITGTIRVLNLAGNFNLPTA